MADETKPPADDHEKRVAETFDAFHETLGEKAEASREALQKLKEATAARDVSAMRDELTAVKESHGWLFEEMTKHPDLAGLVNELARLGL